VSENLDLVRSVYADWERGDFGSTSWADPHVEYVIADGPWPVDRTGLAEMAEGERELLNAFENFRIAASEYREIDHERVLVLSHASGRGKTSGLDFEQIGPKGGACLFHIRDGKAIRFVGYWDQDHALADLGLKE
jgi:ketosteroid isomerase-like protein